MLSLGEICSHSAFFLIYFRQANITVTLASLLLVGTSGSNIVECVEYNLNYLLNRLVFIYGEVRGTGFHCFLVVNTKRGQSQFREGNLSIISFH